MRWGIAVCGLMAAIAARGHGAMRQGPYAGASADASTDAGANAGTVTIEAVRPYAGDADGHAVETGAIEEVGVDGDLPVYVVRAAAGTDARRTVFLTGSCTTPLDYLKALRHAAAEHGGIVAVQGDRPCRDGTRRWSPDTIATSTRIHAALHAAGFDEPATAATATTATTLVGYSQGAERAEWLAHRFPLEYTRFVLIAGPIVPSRDRLAGARGVVTLAGYGDVRENMANGAKRLRRALIPALYMELPGIQHGLLSPAAGSVVGKAFDWLEENALEGAPPPRAQARGVRVRPKRTR
jgi:pimeloyl-ACP methyl ester carboxylesterase